MDMETIYESVKKTGRLVIVEDDVKSGGTGAEIAARVAEDAIEYLNAPVKRIAGLETMIPGTKYGEQLVVPSVEDIRLGISQTAAI